MWTFALLQYTARFNAETVKNYLYMLNDCKIAKKKFNCKLSSSSTILITLCLSLCVCVCVPPPPPPNLPAQKQKEAKMTCKATKHLFDLQGHSTLCAYSSIRSMHTLFMHAREVWVLSMIMTRQRPRRSHIHIRKQCRTTKKIKHAK